MKSSAEKKEYAREWRQRNADKAKASAARWREKNADKIKASTAAYRENNRDALKRNKRAWYLANKEKSLASSKEAYLRRVYGLTTAQKNELLAAQKNSCAICKSPDPGSSRGWHVDHCHNSGRVRGILCNHCNLMLGYARDSRETLAAAIRYLEA